MRAVPVFLLRIFLFGLGPIALGLLNIFGKEYLWNITEASDLLKGKISKRTTLWDIWANAGGVLLIVFGLYMLRAIIVS